MMMVLMLTLTMMTKVSIEPVERWERGILALKIIDELTMWFFTLGDSDDDGDASCLHDGDAYYNYADYHDDDNL